MKNSTKVLIVEDEKDICEVATLILESEGFEVKCAESPTTAVREYDQFKPDVVLLDYFLQGGAKADRFVEHMIESKQTTPIILMSAAAQPEKLAQALKIKSILKKPFNLEALIEVVHSASI